MSKILKNRSNDIASLLQNFSQAENALQTSLDSVGSAAKENAAYIDSIQGRLNQLKATYEDLSSDLLSSTLIKNIVKGGTSILSLIDKSVEGVGALGTALTVLVGTLSASSKYKDFNILPVNLIQNAINKTKELNAVMQEFNYTRETAKAFVGTKGLLSGTGLSSNALGTINRDVTTLFTYLNKIKTGDVVGLDVNTYFKDTTAECQKFVQTQNITNDSIRTFAIQSRNAAQASEGLAVGISSGTKATLGFEMALKALANVGIMLLVSFLVNSVFKWISNTINKIEDAKKEIEDLASSCEETKSKIEEVNSKLEENKKLIDEMNAKPLDNIEKDNLKTLQDENEQLVIRKDILEGIANLNQKTLENKTKEVLNKKQYSLNDNGEILNNLGDRFNSYFKSVYNFDNFKKAFSGDINKIKETSSNNTKQLKDFVFSDKSDYITKYTDSLNKVEQLYENIENLDLTNPEDIKKYFEFSKAIDDTSESLSTNTEYLQEQLNYLSETSNEYKEINNLLNKFKEVTDNATKSTSSFSEELLKEYINTNENFKDEFNEVNDKMSKAQNEYDSDTKHFIKYKNSDDKLNVSDNLNNILRENNITNSIVVKSFGKNEYKLITDSYKDIIGALNEINQLKEKGLWIDTEDNKAIYEALLKSAGISEEDFPVIDYTEQIEAYDYFQSYINGEASGSNGKIDLSNLSATAYKSFTKGLIKNARKNGANSAYFEKILESFFPNYQNNKDLFDSYMKQIPKEMSNSLFSDALNGTLNVDKLKGNEQFIEDLKLLGISAEDAAVYIYELQKSILAEDATARKNTSDSLASNFLSNKSEYDENEKDNFEKYATAITNSQAGNVISSDEMWELIKADSSLADKFKRTSEGYIIASQDLIDSRNNYIKLTANDYRTDITKTKEAIEKSKKAIEDLTTKRDSIVVTDTSSGREFGYWNNQITLEEKNLSDLNDVLAENQKMYDELINPIVNYGETIESVSSKISDAISLYEQMRNEMNKTGSLSGDTLANLIENVPNWEDIVTVDETGTNIIYDEEAFKESIKSSTGYTDKINEAKKLISAYEEGLRNLANKYGITYDGGKTFEENLANIREQLKTSPNFTSKAAEEFTMLSDNMDDAQNAIAVLTVAFENFFKSFEENEYLTKFNEELADLNHKKAMGQLSEADYNAGYSKIYNDFKTNAGDSKDVDVIDALNEAEETNYSNQQSQFQNEYSKEKQLLENAYDDKLKSAKEYYEALEKLNEEYYGDNGKINDVDGTTKIDNERELNELRSTLNVNETDLYKDQYSKGLINFDTLKKKIEESRNYWLSGIESLTDEFKESYYNDNVYFGEQEVEIADRALAQNKITNTKYAHEMGRIWETYYKDIAQFAQEDYEYEQKYLSAIKDSVQDQIDGVQSVIDKNEEFTNAQIEELEEQNDKIEKYYDIQINALEEQIKLIEDKADEEDRYLKIKEAEEALENAQRNKTRFVYDAYGQGEYDYDYEKIEEAKKNLRDAKNENETSAIEKIKEGLEKEKDANMKVNTDKIEELNQSLKLLNDPLEKLVAVMAANLSKSYNVDPEALLNILQTTASQDEINRQNAINKATNNGETLKTDDLIDTGMAVTKALNETESQLNKDNDLKDAYNNAANTEDVTLVEKENSLEKLFPALVQLLNTSTENVDAYKGMPSVPATTQVPILAENSTFMTTIGDIIINTPIGNAEQVALDIQKHLPTSYQQRMLKLTQK